MTTTTTERGTFLLTQVDDDVYVVTGPDPLVDSDLLDGLCLPEAPAGLSWWTEWGEIDADGDTYVWITAR